MSIRVLVLSHNAFSQTQNNGKTLESFFQKWNTDMLAQIYLQPEDPDFSFCNNYYCMSDYEVLNYYLSRGKIGRKVNSECSGTQPTNLNGAIRRLYMQKSLKRGRRSGLNAYIHNKFVERKPAFVFAREILWKHAKWNTDELNSWIANFSPDVLFFQGSSCSFAYQIAETICNSHHIPLILELTDDYTYYQNKFSLFERIVKSKYLKSFQQGISSSKTTITISSYMSEEYQKRFGGNYSVLLNSLSDPMIPMKKINRNISLLYAGNVSIGRWKTLLAIGMALDLINQRNESFSSALYIYTPNPIEEKILSKFNKVQTISYGGSLNSKELKGRICDADFLVHVESFEPKMKQITRLSISTKIPEYLASNRCIFAVGPNDIASMRYLSENHAAITLFTSEVEQIAIVLQKVFLDESLCNSCICNARELYNQNHSLDDSCTKICSIIEQAVSCGKNKIGCKSQ